MSLVLLRRLIKGAFLTPFYVRQWPAFYLIYLYRFIPALRGYLAKRDTVTLRNGIVFSIRPLGFDRYILNEIWIHHDYNPDSRSIQPNDTVVDLGAHLGGFSIYAAQLGAQVYALEPSPQSFELLVKNIKANSLEEKIIPHQVAIGPTKKKIKLYINPSNPAMNSEVARTNETITAQAVTLASIFEKYKIGACNLLKCDIEESEYELFYKLPSQLFEKIERIYLEFHTSTTDPTHTPESLAHFLETKGFTVRQYFTYLYAIKKESGTIAT
jgi:FkbM family methyltransferase